MQGQYYQQPQQVHLQQPHIQVKKAVTYSLCCCCPLSSSSPTGLNFIKSYFKVQSLIFFFSLILHTFLAVAYKYPSYMFLNGKKTGAVEIDTLQFTSRVLEHVILAVACFIGFVINFIPKLGGFKNISTVQTFIWVTIIFDIVHLIFLVKFMFFMLVVGFLGILFGILSGQWNLVILGVVFFYFVAIWVLSMSIGQFVSLCSVGDALGLLREEITKGEGQSGNASFQDNNLSYDYA